jgi:hypothetical protein
MDSGQYVVSFGPEAQRVLKVYGLFKIYSIIMMFAELGKTQIAP